MAKVKSTVLKEFILLILAIKKTVTLNDDKPNTDSELG